MNYADAFDVTEMVLRSWPGGRVWTAEEMEAYAKGLMWMDAEIATHAVAAAQQKVPHRPHVAELREFYDLERAKRRATIERTPEPPPRKEKVPLWVRRWVAARYLYKRFGKDQDLRSFPEQQQFMDPYAEVMPADAWLAEAEHVTDAQVWRTLQT